MKNVHIGWGPVGMSKIGGPSRPKLQLNKINYTGEIGSGFKLEIISKYEEPPVWQSSNENVAVVDQDGNITLVNEGTAVITVTSGKLTGRCTIKVVLSAEQEFLRDIAAGGTITLSSDIVLSNYVEIRNEVVINLNGHSIVHPASSGANYGDVFEVLGEGKLTINGNGEIIAENGYCVYAAGDSNVTLNGGYYFSPVSTVDARKNAIVTINGGEFKVDGSNNPDGDYGQTYTLNLRDKVGKYENELANIIVKGGSFYNFNPANNTADGPNTNYVAEGYESVEVDGNWKVSKVEPGTPEQPSSKLDKSKIYYGVITQQDYENVVVDGLHQIDEDLILKAVNSGTVLLADLKPEQLFEVSHKAGDILFVLMSNFNAYIKNPLGEDLYEFADANGMQEIEGFKLFGELANNTANTLIYVK